MRGKRGKHSLHACRVGITPAGAGKTLLFANFRAFQWDHPRRCGENSILLKLHVAAEGSPPQVRGKPERNISGRSGFGITPAGAGKTASCSLPSRPLKDHPRRCGENRIFNFLFCHRYGSPPQVRGKLCKKQLRPAANQDHPRRCGENENDGFTLGKIIGSPPQVRGKQFAPESTAPLRRITPAGAGKTRQVELCLMKQKDHPRRCGENGFLQAE